MGNCFSWFSRNSMQNDQSLLRQEDLNESSERYEKTISTLKQKIQELQKSERTTQTSLNECQRKYQHEVQEKEKARQELKETLTTARMTKKSLDESQELFQQELQKKENTILELQQKIQELKALKTERTTTTSLSEFKEEYQHKLKENESKISELQRENQELKEALQTSMEGIGERSTKTEMDELKIKYKSELKKRENSISKLKQEIQEVKEKLQKARNRIIGQNPRVFQNIAVVWNLDKVMQQYDYFLKKEYLGAMLQLEKVWASDKVHSFLDELILKTYDFMSERFEDVLAKSVSDIKQYATKCIIPKTGEIKDQIRDFWRTQDGQFTEDQLSEIFKGIGGRINEEENKHLLEHSDLRRFFERLVQISWYMVLQSPRMLFYPVRFRDADLSKHHYCVACLIEGEKLKNELCTVNKNCAIHVVTENVHFDTTSYKE